MGEAKRRKLAGTYPKRRNPLDMKAWLLSRGRTFIEIHGRVMLMREVEHLASYGLQADAEPLSPMQEGLGPVTSHPNIRVQRVIDHLRASNKPLNIPAFFNLTQKQMERLGHEAIERQRAEAGPPIATSYMRPQGSRNHVMVFDTRTLTGKSFVVGLCHGHLESGEPMLHTEIGQMVLDRVAEATSRDLPLVVVEIAASERMRTRVEAAFESAPDGSAVLLLCHEDHLSAVAMQLVGLSGERDVVRH